MKKVFYFKCSNATYLKQEVDSTADSKEVTVQETFIYFPSYGPLPRNLTVYVSKRYLLNKDSLEEDGSYIPPYNPYQKRITRRTFKNNLNRILKQITCDLQSI